MAAVPPANRAQIAQARRKYRFMHRAVEARAVARAWPGRPVPDAWTFTPTEAAAWLADVLEREGVAPAVVTFQAGRERGTHDIETRTVVLPKRAMPVSVVLHEAAHLVNGSSLHSPGWWSTLLRLSREHCPVYGRSLGAAMTFYRVGTA